MESLCRCYRWSHCVSVIGGVIVQVLKVVSLCRCYRWSHCVGVIGGVIV